MCIVASLLLLLFSTYGLDAQTKFSPDITIYTSFKLNWTWARYFCRKHHTDLIMMRSKEENQYFRLAEGWIGLYKTNATNPWKWSRRGQEAKFFDWSSEPSSGKFCVYKKNSDSTWKGDYCRVEHHFSCFDEKLVLVKENKTWEEALNHCRSLGGRRFGDRSSFYLKPVYDLPSMHTNAEHIHAREKAQEASTEEVWTGLRFLAGHWWWVDGEPLQYQDIQSCPTVESCGVLEKNGKSLYKTRDCLEKRNFLCYKSHYIIK